MSYYLKLKFKAKFLVALYFIKYLPYTVWLTELKV